MHFLVLKSVNQLSLIPFSLGVVPSQDISSLTKEEDFLALLRQCVATGLVIDSTEVFVTSISQGVEPSIILLDIAGAICLRHGICLNHTVSVNWMSFYSPYYFHDTERYSGYINVDF